ncbi:hypothetical protein ACU5EH_05350 [Aliivibrio salmonicida]|uniref:hypothetical protein n=1 Tax=Aliivibrio salmonicida TaxID=40269 RepID=UPI00406CC8D6
MTQLLGINVFRTITIPFNGQMYTIRFASSCDYQDNFMLVNNDDTGSQMRIAFDDETAHSYKASNKEDLSRVVLNIIGEEIKAGRI